MTNQPDYNEPLLRFDMYAVIEKDKGDYHIIQMFKNVSWLAAELVSGVSHHDFCQSIEHSGWVGSCPEWRHFSPVVTVPRRERLAPDHLDFMLGELS